MYYICISIYIYNVYMILPALRRRRKSRRLCRWSQSIPRETDRE